MEAGTGRGRMPQGTAALSHTAAYLDMENYNTRQDYMPGQKTFVADLPKFIEELRHKAIK